MKQTRNYKRLNGTGASKCITGDAKCVTEILGDKNKEVGGGAKFTFYPFVLSENKRIKPIAEILGDRNKEVGVQHSSSWAFHSSTSISVE